MNEKHGLRQKDIKTFQLIRVYCTQIPTLPRSRQNLVNFAARSRPHTICPGARRVPHLEHELRVASDARAELCRQAQCFVERISVEGLSASHHGCHGFHGGAHDVVVRVLLWKRDASTTGRFRFDRSRFEILAMNTRCRKNSYR